ncbi:hypothetical protein [Nocardioides sp.]|uniref:hypothetical protein n=1 Tax=Nocardioides sp. TaxID=35761 RepID=UPI00271FE537|nr:hypothetical protein [Nocardioides sp.]MDO9455637.1 hypothetical protein [Nocardioides sp.]
MSEPRVTLRARDAVLAALAASIAFLLPTLAAGLDGTATLTGALLAVALAALLRTAHDSGHLGARTTSARVSARRASPIVLATRATDPTHHPLRPRAPGSR